MAFDPLSAAAIGGSGLLGAAGSIFTNQQNLNAANEAQNWNKYAQQRTWEREDNAVQRRVADLKAAGLSPVLAAGSSAQAGSPMKIDPVESKDALGTEAMMAGVTRAAQTQQSVAAAEAAKMQAQLTGTMIGKTQAETALTGTKNAVLNKEFGLYGSAGGHPKYQDVWGKRISSLLEGMKNFNKSGGAPKFSPKPDERKRQENELKRQAPFGGPASVIDNLIFRE